MWCHSRGLVLNKKVEELFDKMASKCCGSLSRTLLNTELSASPMTRDVAKCMLSLRLSVNNFCSFTGYTQDNALGFSMELPKQHSFVSCFNLATYDEIYCAGLEFKSTIHKSPLYLLYLLFNYYN